MRHMITAILPSTKTPTKPHLILPNAFALLEVLGIRPGPGVASRNEPANHSSSLGNDEIATMSQTLNSSSDYNAA